MKRSPFEQGLEATKSYQSLRHPPLKAGTPIGLGQIPVPETQTLPTTSPEAWIPKPQYPAPTGSKLTRQALARALAHQAEQGRARRELRTCRNPKLKPPGQFGLGHVRIPRSLVGRSSGPAAGGRGVDGSEQTRRRPDVKRLPPRWRTRAPDTPRQERTSRRQSEKSLSGKAWGPEDMHLTLVGRSPCDQDFEQEALLP